MVRKPRYIPTRNVDGFDLTHTQEKYYRHLKKKIRPRGPTEVGKELSTTKGAAWRILDNLECHKKAIEKTDKGKYFVQDRRTERWLKNNQ